MKYFTSTSFSSSYTITSLALSSDQSKVILAFGPNFMMATVDIGSGQILYSGTSTSLVSAYSVAPSGVGHSSLNPFSSKTDISGQSIHISKFSIDYKEQWNIIMPSPSLAVSL